MEDHGSSQSGGACGRKTGVKMTNIGRVRGMDNELLSRRFEVESKLFFLDFKQNPSGRFLKITARSGGRRLSFVIVPEGGLRFFREGA
jgi:hypothetical protein